MTAPGPALSFTLTLTRGAVVRLALATAARPYPMWVVDAEGTSHGGGHVELLQLFDGDRHDEATAFAKQLAKGAVVSAQCAFEHITLRLRDAQIHVDQPAPPPKAAPAPAPAPAPAEQELLAL